MRDLRFKLALTNSSCEARNRARQAVASTLEGMLVGVCVYIYRRALIKRPPGGVF